MKKMNKPTKVALFSLSTFIAIISSLLCAIFSSMSFSNNEEEAISALIEDELKKQDKGNAIYSMIDFPYSDENIELINNEKKAFDQILYSIMSKAETDVSATVDSLKINNITLLETTTYNNEYNDMHIYSGIRWYYFNEEIDRVFISSTLEKKLIEGTSLQNAKGLKINISANGVSKLLTIGGAFSNGLYPQYTGLAARGDSLQSAVGETIFIHPEILMDFAPSKAICMFAQGSINNGQKLINIRNLCQNYNFSLTNNLDPMKDSTFSSDIKSLEKTYHSSGKIILRISLILVLFLLQPPLIYTLRLLTKEIDYCKKENIKNILSSLIVDFVLILIFVLFIILAKKITIPINGFVKAPLLSKSTFLLCLIPAVSSFVYLIILKKKYLLLLFKEKENNSIFDD